jgi:hypothetical protein
MSTINLSEEDNRRIADAEFYSNAKTIMRSFEEYRHVNIGEVYSILYRNHSDKLVYISRGKSKDKYMVIHKDDGFAFAKRINSDGSLSKNVICLTIRYPQPYYSVELDSEQAEAIIFQNEESFDPFKQGKELAKKKNKARKLNKIKVITHNTAQDALTFISNLKMGDTLFDAGTTFGEGVVEWKVVNIERRALDKTPQSDWSHKIFAYGKTDIDQKSNRHHLNDFIKVTLSVVGEVPNSRMWINKNRDISFIDFLVCNERRRDWYLTRPTTTDEV